MTQLKKIANIYSREVTSLGLMTVVSPRIQAPRLKTSRLMTGILRRSQVPKRKTTLSLSSAISHLDIKADEGVDSGAKDNKTSIDENGRLEVRS